MLAIFTEVAMLLQPATHYMQHWDEKKGIDISITF